jgi:hypothetical protein
VVALSLVGEELWISNPPLDGIASGTPVASENGEFVFLTHNSESKTVGHFTILEAGNNGTEFLSQPNVAGPFGSPGIYHSPEEGYYAGGENNRNDIIVWSIQPKPDDETVGAGATFAFQFPVGFTGDADGLNFTLLGTNARDFQAVQKPVLTNKGRSMYWGTSRSQFRCWVGQEGFDRYRFSQPRYATVGFSRGTPPKQAIFASLALSNDPEQPYVFGGSASTEFVRLNFDYSEELSISTSSVIHTQARVTPDDLYVYYVEFNGQLHQASVDDLMDTWMYDFRVPVEGEFALNADGTVLYIADVTGLISALRVADPPSEAPSVAPSKVPSSAPTPNPTNFPTVEPSSSPIKSPTPAPFTHKPNKAPTPTSGAPSLRAVVAPLLLAIVAMAVVVVAI